MTSRARAAFAAVIAVALLAACAQGGAGNTTSTSPQAPQAAALRLADVVPVANPASLTGPVTAVIESASVSVLDATEATLPATVTSRTPSGEAQVTVQDTSRIVAVDVAGAIATTVYALGFGQNLVGIDSSVELEGIDAEVVTTSGHAVSPEAVLALRPSIVITDGTVGPVEAFSQLADAGVTVVFVDPGPGFTGAQELAEQVGEALGVAASGTELAQRIAAEVEDVKAQVASLVPADEEARPRIVFLYLRGGAGVYYLFGAKYGADQLIEALGGIDVAAEMGINDMAPLTDEAMLAADPDVLLVMSDGLESVGGVDGLLDLSPAIALTSAGQNRRVIDMNDREILGFGPRSAAVLEALAAALYSPGE